jgi:1,4-alpha-glucan branching enzyme
MEVRSLIRNLIMLICICAFAVPLLSNAQKAAPPVKIYTIKDGNMYIALSKQLKKSSLDSFIAKYDLSDLSLDRFIKTDSFDHLKKLGWKLEANDPEVFVISKPLISSKKMGDPADKISYTGKQGAEKPSFPIVSDKVVYGCNQFSKNKFPFAVKESEVTFFLKNNLQSKRVMLAGSFNDWDPEATAMMKTDSGWITRLKLRPGKYWYKFVADGNWMVDNDNLLREDDGFGNTNSVYYQSNVIFRLDSFTQAKRVFVAGNFNNWQEKVLQMRRTPHGWMLPIYLAEGTHTYKFNADGVWLTDPKNMNRLPDGHNGFNSVISLGTPYVFKLNGFTNAKRIVLTGTFNNWREDELFMQKSSTGWELPYILRPGNYEYKFIVDGTWVADPANPLSVDNEAGTKNSVLVINPNYTFRLKGFASAKKIYLAGDFNNWNETSLPMKHQGDEWVFSVHLSPGKHKYKFLVDGNWITDPANKLWEQNEYGTGNSVVWVEQ